MANEFYAIHTNLAALKALTATNLLMEPHPTEFHEGFDVVATAGDGDPIELGFAWCVWTWGNVFMVASEWHQLMAYVGNLPSASVYIRTRTNQISGSKYEYKYYSTKMFRPEGKSAPHWRFRDVTVKFTRLVEV